MNKIILFTMKWLDNPDQFTEVQVKANKDAAADTAAHATAHTATAATYSAYYANYYAAAAAVYDTVDNTIFYIDEYFRITGEDKQLYLDQIKADKEVIECCECGANIIFSHNDTNITCDIIDGQYTETRAINCPHCGVENTTE